jgi:ribose transport system permease protein
VRAISLIVSSLVAAFAGVLYTGMRGLNFLGADSFVQNLFYGGGLVVAVSISQLVRKRQAMD